MNGMLIALCLMAVAYIFLLIAAVAMVKPLRTGQDRLVIALKEKASAQEKMISALKEQQDAKLRCIAALEGLVKVNTETVEFLRQQLEMRDDLLATLTP